MKRYQFFCLLLVLAASVAFADGTWRGVKHSATSAIFMTDVTYEEPAGKATVGQFSAFQLLDVSTTEVTSGLIPANAYDVHVFTRNTTTVVGTTATSYDVGIEGGGNLDEFGNDIAFTDTVSTDMTDWTVTDPTAANLNFSASAREVRLTPQPSGTLDTGSVQVVAG